MSNVKPPTPFALKGASTRPRASFEINTQAFKAILPGDTPSSVRTVSFNKSSPHNVLLSAGETQTTCAPVQGFELSKNNHLCIRTSEKTTVDVGEVPGDTLNIAKAWVTDANALLETM